jgi:hypothetical protein
MVRVYDRLGGEERLLKWADENYGDYVKILSRIAPRPQVDSEQTEMRIIVDSRLERSALS